MKSVLISIQPKWCELIANGEKTVEVRKTKPKLETPFKVYIYCTADRRKSISDTYIPKTPLFMKNGMAKSSVGKEDGLPWKLANGKVIGEFVCDCIANYEAELWDDETFERIQEFYEPDDFAEYGEYEYKTIADNSDDFWKENMLCKASCLSIEELRKYLGTGISDFYGWGISNLVIYDKPRELSEFSSGSSRLEFSNTEDGFPLKWSGMTRPPQSWCYVESEVEGE